MCTKMFRVYILVFFLTYLNTSCAVFPAKQCEWFGKRKDIGASWSRGCTDYSCDESGLVKITRREGCETKDGKCIEVNSVIEIKRKCTYLKCKSNGKKPILTKGCKFDKTCYPPGHIEKPNSCSELECTTRGKFTANKLRCETGERKCLNNGDEWGESGANSCYSKKCVAKLSKSGRKMDLRIKQLSKSLHCKERFSDICHGRKDIWIEFNMSKGKCEVVGCKVNGPKVLKRQTVCTYDGKCIQDGMVPKGAPMCKCVKGQMKCRGPLISA